MNETSRQITRLADYTPPVYLVDAIHLEFQLHDAETRVHARLVMRRNPETRSTETTLRLDGRELELLDIHLNGQPLSQDRFTLTGEHLLVPDVPPSFTLETTTRIRPQENLSLEGLYRSNSLFCTQCEAEGFRKITFYPDRPDVMARFTVMIEADQTTVPVLLSNGNLKETGTRPNNRHFALWEDPFPKPSYLFALVAGTLVCHEGSFVTGSGRTIRLQIWVEPENITQCQHALDSLQKSMAWDEKRFGREYDLDLYMIVAVNDFNMGAMENKGLNIFNAQYVLADPETATDSNYEEIESVIAHEYFHNWTGNRITCRDWFQLSLKEGLTIFRDQEFSSDVGSRAVQRIRDVQDLRIHQFPEDAGPTRHPVRPDSYMEINNFYTTTIYNKGAEVVRMLQTLLGKEQFRQGMDLYFLRHDGQAVTVEAFIQAMQDASKRDLSHFMHWYHQAGTPELTVHLNPIPASNSLELTIEQPNPPFFIPLSMALLDPITATPWPLILEGEDPANAPTERILEITRPVEKFRFTGISRTPIPSLLRDFSAPVKLQTDDSDEELTFLWGADNNPFNRWDAGQRLITRILLQPGKPELPAHFLNAFTATLQETTLDPAMIALALTLPTLALLVEAMENADPNALHQTREAVRRQIAVACQEPLLRVHTANLTPRPYERDPASIGRRSLKNLILNYLMALPNNDLPAQLAVEQIRQADNMTDRLGALIPLVHAGRPEALELLAAMERRWNNNPLALDKWFAIQASAPLENALEQVRALMNHPKFDPNNPNRVRAVITTFCRLNLSRFHDPSGDGYRFLTEQILSLDPKNPQVAARLTGAFSRWRRFEPIRQQAMKAALEEIVRFPTLSRNTYEIASKSLDGLH
ncbi:MAG: aminopeptidase N [Magnetococcales bacterium]|nr:aminopeptidase N [Magnetococcales bacterium]